MKGRFALISVYQKEGLSELAQILERIGVRIIATGGTAKFLKSHRLSPLSIEVVTGNPESFDGRMKSISFQVASGILFDRENKQHVRQAKKLNIPMIDFVICNFYPFWEKETIENIDIGGPMMVRAAAKNYKNVTVVVDPKDYQTLFDKLRLKRIIDENTKKKLAAKAFAYVSEYDVNISNFFQKNQSHKSLFISPNEGITLRYGENPHQKGQVVFEKTNHDKLSLKNFKIIQGKQPSFNNLLDVNTGLEVIALIGKKSPACVIIKHTNPCGASVNTSIEKAFIKSWFDGDPLAAFGGVILINRPVTKSLAQLMLSGKKFFEVLVAPRFEKEALLVFTRKTKLQLWENKALLRPSLMPYQDVKKIRGGFLVQEGDVHQATENHFRAVTQKKPTKKQIEDLLFAWEISQASKSNCVVVVKNQTLLSSGVGQQDRKRCCELCVSKAVKSLKGAVTATDGFFPFRDGPDILIKAGIMAIAQPGGSIRDQEVIKACDEKGVAMVFTGVRNFKH